MAAFHAQNSLAEGITAADFLSWSRQSQDWYIETSVAMAGIVAAQNPTDHAECINDWYFKTDQTRQAAHDFVRGTMQRFQGHHPGTVMIAVLERACGSFDMM
ncbi:MAG: hypothetical protein AAGG06_09715 [Pseudomonadota bacterium]